MLAIISTIKTRKVHGFSLIEAMVATAFIAVFSMAVIVAQAGHWNLVLASQDKTMATHLAEEMIELTMAMRFEELVQANFPEEDYGDIPNFSDFRREVVITPTAADLCNIAVIVSWRKADRADQPVIMVTTVTQRPESAT